VKLSAAIMTHPERGSVLTHHPAQLDRVVPVYSDPGGPPSGHGDRVWSVARETWGMYDPGAGYHALIQDDAVPCADLLAGLEQALDHLPHNAIVSPYLGSGRAVPDRWSRMAREADRQRASWVRSDRVMWGVCLLAPTEIIPDMITWCDRKAGMPDDMRVGAYAQRHGLEVWYTWPSLVDHRADMPSLTKHRARERVAHRHHQGSALSLRWDSSVIADPMFRRRTAVRSAPRSAGRARVAP
jgi:hypothetical protein